MHINYANLYRNQNDVDPNYRFDSTNDTGMYTVNLIAEGDISLTVNSISLSGAGFNSGEATLLSQPSLPLIMHDGDTFQIVIKVESKLDDNRSVTLTVGHTGYNLEYNKTFSWAAGPASYIFVLDKSGSMSASFNGNINVKDENGNILRYPNRWQATQSLAADKISALPSNATFDVITFATNIYICFSMKKTASNGNKASAISWIYNQGTTGCTNGYDGLKAAFSNYGQVDSIEFITDGYMNTALSIGCGACACSGWICNRIITDATPWIQAQAALYSYFELKAIQIGGSPFAFMTQLGSLQNCSYELK
jgi:hypothetical protein